MNTTHMFLAIPLQFVEEPTFDDKGRGSRGWVLHGFDRHTGQLIATKELQLTRHAVWLEIKREVELGKRLEVKTITTIN